MDNGEITRDDLKALLEKICKQDRKQQQLTKIVRQLYREQKRRGKVDYKFHGASVRIYKRIKGCTYIVERFITEEEYQDEKFWEHLIEKHGDDLVRAYRPYRRERKRA